MTATGKTALRFAVWDEFAQQCARRIPHDDPIAFADPLAQKVKEGRYAVFQVVQGETPIGVVVYDIQEKNGRELVIIAAYAQAPHFDLTGLHLPDVEAHARHLGCCSIRFHTIRPGLVAKALKQNFRVSEFILRKNVSQ